MKMILPAIAIIGSATAMAADLKFNAEGRFDYYSTTVKHEKETAANNNEEKRAEFASGALRLNALATFNDNLSFRMRYRLSTKQDTNNRDLSLTNVDFFYLDHKTEWFTARIGKQSQADSLGREFYVAGTDYPVTTSKFATGNAAWTTGYGSVNSLVYNKVKEDADLYRIGASLTFTQVPSSNIILSAFNPESSTTYSDASGNADNAKNTKLGMGLYFNGNYFEKMLQPTLGFTKFSIAPNTGAATSPDASRTLISVGLRSELFGFVADLDWKQYKRDNTVANPTSSTNTGDKSTSIWLNVAYTWDNLTPFISYVNDKLDRNADNTTTVGDYKRNALTVGLNIKPFKDQNFRYHVAYTNDVKTTTLATSSTVDKKVTANTFLAGIKFDI
jgi:hypothetical protein